MVSYRDATLPCQYLEGAIYTDLNTHLNKYHVAFNPTYRSLSTD